MIQNFNTLDFPFQHPSGYSSNLDDAGMQLLLKELLRKNGKVPSSDFKQIYNSKGESRVINNAISDDGIQRQLDTLTQIGKEVFTQKNYTINWAKFVPVSTEGAYLESMFNYAIVPETTNYLSSFYKLSSQSRSTISDYSITSKTVNFGAWKRKVVYDIFKIKQGEIVNFNHIQQILAAEKKANDLGVQELIFLGQPNSTEFEGLLNNSAYTFDNTFITDFLKNLDVTNFQAFCIELIQKYWKNSNYTMVPNRLIIPAEDLGFAAQQVSNTFPIKNRKTLLLESIKTEISSITGIKEEEVDFEVLQTPYANKDNMTTRGFANNVYLLYNYSTNIEESGLKVNIPLNFVNYGTTPVEGNTIFESVYLTQMSGVNIYRPKQFYYFGHNK